ncbi:Cell fate regulator YaaT, PSP1 superfamily (controls sporulation, competence, biofilm development) [Pilibacter termitis]|uniref:Cell fate regulator YaaT, PSP1 superfamily (Controls sporulation, competence, biofilm development) n=1 Tax=Pilibacter termitis TaxID=263852 RepID=A0A1T4PB84_9ENTE|nr:stage 0 sporulation family protein [Pilibacter termitis]SJZ88815.1 Cell fate regulator YaaT, PSP1 superfamily (controls sporulation, competence, biofilm development) [Pilibacter termitis]
MSVVGVTIKNNGVVHYYHAGSENLRVGDAVLVETVRGIVLAKVSTLAFKEEISSKKEIPEILKKASELEIQQIAQNEQEAKDAVPIVKEKIHKYNLDMKLINIEYMYDRSKMLIHFTSDDRVDFRELVRDLASCFKTRIELRQIGVRDEAKILGGLGPCGRVLCCTSYLGSFAPVSIKMAKDQGLSLNPVKISGICGRLMCCLNYEQEEYEEAKREMPDWGKTVKTPDGIGRVEGINLLSRIVSVKLNGKEVATEYLASEISLLK